VLVITKGSIDDCNTKHAQGGIAAAISRKDSPELHFQDTIAAGDGLCDEEMVRILVNEGPARIADLVNLGVPFDTLDGEMALVVDVTSEKGGLQEGFLAFDKILKIGHI
jgi:L-aspartate oxidase